MQRALALRGDLPRPRAFLPAALVLALSGCLVPQAVDPASSRQHQPPRFLVETLPDYEQPAELVLVRSSLDAAQGCHCVLELRAPDIEELDATADLETRWFVDYAPNDVTARLPRLPPAKLAGSVDPTLTQRSGPTFQFDVSSFGILEDGTHVVDLVVAEQGAFADTAAAPAAPFRTLVAGYGSATWRFVVRVQTNNDQRCPNTPPSQRTGTCSP